MTPPVTTLSPEEAVQKLKYYQKGTFTVGNRLVAEAQRSLAKSAARAWGHEGITVNCVAVPAALLRSSTTAVESGDEDPDRPGQPPPALAESPDLEGRVAALVASLVAGPWRGVTGATIAVDAGVWMTP